MKELPYFKFYVAEWLNGDITLEDYYTQGLFTNICAYYWSKGCSITLTQLRKKFRDAQERYIDDLLSSGVLKIKDDFVIISFLDEQFLDWQNLSKKNSQNGKKGGRPIGSIKRDKTQKKATAFNSLTQTQSETKAKKTNIEYSIEDKIIIKEDNSIYRAFAHLKISFIEVEKLNKEGFSIEKVDDILNRIENYAKNKNFKSLYLTALNWLKDDQKKNGNGLPEKGIKRILAVNEQVKNPFL